MDEQNLKTAEWWRDTDLLRKEQEIYDVVRGKIQGLHSDMGKRCNRAEMYDVGQKLGLLRDGTLCFESEEHTAVYSDYLFHFSRLHGSTPCERYLKSTKLKADAGEIERLVHAALAGVRYTVLRVDEPITGFGALCHDCFLEKDVFLMDRGISRTGGQTALATAVYPFKNWFATTGAVLPLPIEELDRTLADFFTLAGLKFAPPVKLSPPDASRVALKMIQIAIGSGVMEKVRYQ